MSLPPTEEMKELLLSEDNSDNALSFAVRMIKSRAILLSSRLVIVTFVIWLLSRSVRNHRSSYAINQGEDKFIDGATTFPFKDNWANP